MNILNILAEYENYSINDLLPNFYVWFYYVYFPNGIKCEFAGFLYPCQSDFVKFVNSAYKEEF